MSEYHLVHGTTTLLPTTLTATLKDTLKALGIKKLNSSVIKVVSPAITGMISSINHLVKVENVK